MVNIVNGDNSLVLRRSVSVAAGNHFHSGGVGAVPVTRFEDKLHLCSGSLNRTVLKTGDHTCCVANRFDLLIY